VRNVITIWIKELRDALLDRRTLLAGVLAPLLLTAGMIVAMRALGGSATMHTVHVAVSSGSAPAVVRLLRAQPRVDVVEDTDPAEAVRRGRADAGLVVPPDFAWDVAMGRESQVTVVTDAVGGSSAQAAAALDAALALYRADVVAGRVRARGVVPAVLTPFVVAELDVAVAGAAASLALATLVASVLIIFAQLGGLFAAIDVSAGEKERGTLEVLLLVPVTTLELTLGKLLAVATLSLGTIALALFSLAVTLRLTPLDPIGPATTVTPAAIMVVVALGTLLALSFAAIELALGIFAHSFKEAQTYVTPLYVVVTVAIVAGLVPGFTPALSFYLIPVVNAVLVFKEAFLGAVDPVHLLLAVAGMLLFSAATVAVTLRIFDDERVLARA